MLNYVGLFLFCFVFNQMIQSFELCKSPTSVFPFTFLADDPLEQGHFVQFLAKAILFPVATSKIHGNKISGTTQIGAQAKEALFQAMARYREARRL